MRTPFYKMSEFWIGAVDAAINIAMLFLVEFAPGQVVELVQQSIFYVQPLVILVIVSMLGERVSAAAHKIVVAAMDVMAQRQDETD